MQTARIKSPNRKIINMWIHDGLVGEKKLPPPLKTNLKFTGSSRGGTFSDGD